MNKQKAAGKGYILYDSNTGSLLEKAQLQRRKRISGCQELREGSQGKETIVFEITIVSYVIIYLSKPIEGATPGVNSNINYDIQVIMTCRFIVPNLCTTPWGMQIMVELKHMSVRIINGISVPSPQFCSDPKLLQRNDTFKRGKVKRESQWQTNILPVDRAF